MGWFSNTLTPNRIINHALIQQGIQSMDVSNKTLAGANQFVSDQSDRAQKLMAQAFSMQGESSSLGKQLQAALNDLSRYLGDQEDVSEDLMSRLAQMLVLTADFQTPRMQRCIPASGQEIAATLAQHAGDVEQNLRVLRRDNESRVVNAVRVIDNADHELNGARTRGNSSFLSRLS